MTDNLTRLHTQETQDEETRLRNMRLTPEKVIIDLCGEYGKTKEERLEE